MIGEVVGHFEIQSELGRGGMARVFKAWDRVLNRHVAIKVLNATPGEGPFAPGDSDYARILHEARAASRLDHPNIAPVHQVFTVGQRAFLVMQLVNGPSLRQRLHAGPLALDEGRRIAVAIARGLSEAHRCGVLHRDIKPENILLTDRGEVKLTDFGIARVAALDTGTVTATIHGTPGYLPPEVLNGAPHDARGDVYSAGLTIYETMAGGHPYARATTAATLAAVLTEDAPPLSEVQPGIPPSLSRLVMRAMAREPAERFENASDLLASLEGESPVEWIPSPSGSIRAVPRVGLKRPLWQLALIPAVILAIITAAGLMWRSSRPTAAATPVVLGQVVGPTGQPVSGALVTIDGHLFQARTSSDGRFHGEVLDGTAGEQMLLRVSHDRFITHTHWIELNAASKESLEIDLVPVD
ncbi:MAG TPA: protein kinase [Candidatus Eisenbacteria bacterium]